MMRELGAFQSSVDVPWRSFQMLSLAPLDDTYKRKPSPNRGEEPLLVAKGMRVAAAASTGPAAIGTRHRIPLGRATVATSRRPSPLADRDVNRSMPKPVRWGTRRLTSTV